MDGDGEDELHRELMKRISSLSKREFMEVVKAAIKESINEKVNEFGWWSLKTLAALGVAGIIGLSLWLQSQPGR